MNQFEMEGNRFYSGNEFDGGRIVLLSSGNARAYPSPWIDIAPLRKGRRKVPIPDKILLIVHALVLSQESDAESMRAMGPANSEKEAENHFLFERQANYAAEEARRNAVLLFNGPVEAARSTFDLRSWLLTESSSFTPEEQRGLEIALRTAKESVRSDGIISLLSAIVKLTESNKRPPFRSELQKALGIDPREDDREFRRLLKYAGFGWLPIDTKNIGRPRKSRG